MAKELEILDGQLVEVVKSTRGLELAELEAAVNATQAVLDEVRNRKRAEFEASLENDEEVVTARTAADDSKSDLARGQELVGQLPAAGVDLGTDGTSVDQTATDAGSNDTVSF